MGTKGKQRNVSYLGVPLSVASGSHYFTDAIFAAISLKYCIILMKPRKIHKQSKVTPLLSGGAANSCTASDLSQ